MDQRQRAANKQKHASSLSNPDVDMTVKNFGPVLFAHLSLKPLTIFAGPNNSGKSYVASLIHTMMPSQLRNTWLDLLQSYGDRLLNGVGNDAEYPLQKDARNCLTAIKQLIKPGTTEIPDDITRKLVRFYFEIMKEGLVSVIKRNFGSSPHDLIMMEKCSITMGDSGIRITIGKENVRIKMPPKPDIRLVIEIGKDVTHLSIRKNGDEERIVTGHVKPKNLSESHVWHVMVLIFLYVARMFKSNILYSNYLPASRSGLMTGHRLMTSGIIQSAAYAGTDGMTIPKLSGITSDFMSALIDAPQSKGTFYNIAESLEREMGGEITRTVNPDTHFPEILYQYKQKKVPLHRTSSSVSELAPLVLYLKHVVGKDELLILEEPEAHLDFKMQRILARHIAKMVRAGLKVLITTHSFFVQEQLGLCLSYGRLASNASKKVPLAKDERLQTDEVAYYLFDKNDADNGYVARPEKISPEDGIPLKKFDEAVEKLHDDKVTVAYGQ